MNEFYRGRRLRRNPVIREMVRETQAVPPLTL